jgi:hypothetical protein
MLRAACLSAALFACAPALAQNYGGTYTTKNASGGTVTLTLVQDAASRVSGTLTGHGSTSLHIQASIERDSLRGTAGNSYGMLYLTGRLNGEELSLVLTESDVGGKPNPRRASQFLLSKNLAKAAPQSEQLSQALTRNAWCNFTYNVSGNRKMERLVFTSSGLVTQTPGKQARWRVQNETLEFSPDGIIWSPQALRLALNASGSPVLQSHDKEYGQCN